MAEMQREILERLKAARDELQATLPQFNERGRKVGEGLKKNFRKQLSRLLSLLLTRYKHSEEISEQLARSIQESTTEDYSELLAWQDRGSQHSDFIECMTTEGANYLQAYAERTALLVTSISDQEIAIVSRFMEAENTRYGVEIFYHSNP